MGIRAGTVAIGIAAAGAAVTGMMTVGVAAT